MIAIPGGITGAVLGEGWPFPSFSLLSWLAIRFWGLVALAISFLASAACGEHDSEGERTQIG